MNALTPIAAVIPHLTTGVSAPGSAGSEVAAPSNDPAMSFEAVLQRLSDTAMNDLKAGEAKALEGLEGKASVREVVDAVMTAERTLQTVVAVRDKVISAYQEISRMQI